MAIENGEWIMRGMDWDDPARIRSWEELIDWINALQIGGISANRIKSELPFIGVIVKKDEDLEGLGQRIN